MPNSIALTILSFTSAASLALMLAAPQPPIFLAALAIHCTCAALFLVYFFRKNP